MQVLYSPSTIAALDDVNKPIAPLKPAKLNGTTAAENYDNVQVLGDVDKAEFARLMLSFKAWVAPKEGCGYCHNAPDYASDEKYPKRVARIMIAMTRRINSEWTQHVKGTGVTCYTCHRGQPVPPRVWYSVATPPQDGFMARRPEGRPPTPAAHSTALPADPLSDYLLGDKDIRVVGKTALQSGNTHSIAQAKSTYSMMMVMAESLGVNCTYCHNTQSFTSWELSPPTRVTAWYGIRMARDLNNAYMGQVAEMLPAERLGPAGDGPKVYCATCHIGTSKPLRGASMIQAYPELVAPSVHPTTVAATPEPESGANQPARGAAAQQHPESSPWPTASATEVVAAAGPGQAHQVVRSAKP